MVGGIGRHESLPVNSSLDLVGRYRIVCRGGRRSYGWPGRGADWRFRRRWRRGDGRRRSSRWRRARRTRRRWREHARRRRHSRCTLRCGRWAAGRCWSGARDRGRGDAQHQRPDSHHKRQTDGARLASRPRVHRRYNVTTLHPKRFPVSSEVATLLEEPAWCVFRVGSPVISLCRSCSPALASHQRPPSPRLGRHRPRRLGGSSPSIG